MKIIKFLYYLQQLEVKIWLSGSDLEVEFPKGSLDKV